MLYHLPEDILFQVAVRLPMIREHHGLLVLRRSTSLLELPSFCPTILLASIPDENTSPFTCPAGHTGIPMTDLFLFSDEMGYCVEVTRTCQHGSPCMWIRKHRTTTFWEENGRWNHSQSTVDIHLDGHSPLWHSNDEDEDGNLSDS